MFKFDHLDLIIQGPLLKPIAQRVVGFQLKGFLVPTIFAALHDFLRITKKLPRIFKGINLNHNFSIVI